VLGLCRGYNDEVIVPNGDTILHPEDAIIIFVKAGNVKNVMPAFEGKE
jgi:Trk K+ transport system NAD-binding subunit